MHITGIILAGGKSKRMGRDKALLKLDGQTLLGRAVKLCQQNCSEIIISSNNPSHQFPDLPIINDEIENCGPLGGITSCLKHAKHDWCFVVSVDSPFVEPEFVTFLKTQTNTFDAIVPFTEKGKEPLVALYNRSVLPVAKSLIVQKQFRMHNFISEINTQFLDTNSWLENYPLLFNNLNLPDDAREIGLESL